MELSEKDVKSLKILDLIIKKGIISRTEISKITGINIVSISNYIHKYIEHKLIIEKGFDVSTGGRKPELVELNTNDNRVIGVEIGKSCVPDRADRYRIECNRKILYPQAWQGYRGGHRNSLLTY